MTKIQRPGFIISAVMFIIMGILFIFFGLKFDNSVLKYMGYFWLPAGILHLAIVMLFLYKKKM